MMTVSKRIPLTIKQIFEKEFKISFAGYDREAVDQFLDEIIKDYACFQKELEQFMDENIKLKKELDSKQKTNNHSNQDRGQINYDIIQRLAKLEKKVYQDS